MKEDEKKKRLDFLFQNEAFLKNLDQVKNEDERRKIKAFSEDFFLKFLEGFEKIKKISEEHPDIVAKVAEKRIDKK
jgi:hypothetical protein